MATMYYDKKKNLYLEKDVKSNVIVILGLVEITRGN